MKNKSLWIIFMSLLVVYLGTRFWGKPRSSNFNADLVQLDTAEVSRILLGGNGPESEAVELIRSEHGWIATHKNLSVPAEQRPVSGLLGQLVHIRARQIVARSPDKWPDYELTDTAATTVEVHGNGELLERFHLGRFSFNQATRSGTSFLRLGDDPEVYAVEGFLSMSFSPEFEAYRSKTFTNFFPDQVRSIRVTKPGGIEESMQIKEEGGWIISLGWEPDSSEVTSFLSGISRTFGKTFRDDVDPLSASVEGCGRMEVHLNDQPEPVVIQCLGDRADLGTLLLNSSQNPQAWFESDTSGMYRNFFPVWEEIVNGPES